MEYYIYVSHYLKNFCKRNFIYKFVYDYAEGFNFIIDRGPFVKVSIMSMKHSVVFLRSLTVFLPYFGW